VGAKIHRVVAANEFFSINPLENDSGVFTGQTRAQSKNLK
jgi:hypothetical protein